MARARILLCAGFFLLAGCSPDHATATDGGNDGDPFFADFDAGDPFAVDGSLGRRTQIFLSGCNGTEGCHSDNVAGLTFPPGDATRFLIDAASSERPELLRVKPGDPSASYLYLKLLDDGGIKGARMPPGSPLDPRLPALFFQWIEAGSPPP
jgi:hypothetical protein